MAVPCPPSRRALAPVSSAARTAHCEDAPGQPPGCAPGLHRAAGAHQEGVPGRGPEEPVAHGSLQVRPGPDLCLRQAPDPLLSDPQSGQHPVEESADRAEWCVRRAVEGLPGEGSQEPGQGKGSKEGVASPEKTDSLPDGSLWLLFFFPY